MKILWAACLLGLGAAAVPLTPARAQIESREGIALQNMILELRQEVQTLRDQGLHDQTGRSSLAPLPSGGGSAANNDFNAQLLDRVQRLEDQMRQLRGRIDEVNNARQRQGDDLAKQIGDLNFRLQNGAGAAVPGATAAAPVLGPPPASVSPPGQPDLVKPSDGLPVPPPPPPKRTAETLLQEGNAALSRRDYAVAETAAKEVLATGKGPRSTDAQFLLAQSLAGRKDYTGAAVAYDDAYNRSRSGLHAQDSLLGLAGALTSIGEKRAACETLDKLRAEFPNPRADLKDAAVAARRNAACK